MRFYREATIRDFQLAEFEFEERIPLKVRTMFNPFQPNIPQTVRVWRETPGVDLHSAVKVLKEYQAFRKAYSDFLSDKKVFTEY